MTTTRNRQRIDPTTMKTAFEWETLRGSYLLDPSGFRARVIPGWRVPAEWRATARSMRREERARRKVRQAAAKKART